MREQRSENEGLTGGTRNYFGGGGLTSQQGAGEVNCRMGDGIEGFEGKPARKKKRHERYSCSCREASDANYSRLGGDLTASQPE